MVSGGLINAVGIDSPGLTSSPAIAEYIRDMIAERYFDLKPDGSKKTEYRIRPLFRDLSDKDKEIWLKKDPRFGRIVCRCENVTEGDIVSAIHSPIPAVTADAIKFKTWAGAGRCQGSFDLPRLISILCEELNIEPTRVLKNDPGSNIILDHSRGSGDGADHEKTA